MSALLAREQDVRPAGPGHAPAGRSAKTSQRSPLDRQRRKLFVPFVMPALLFYVVLFVVPIIAAAWISLHTWAGAGEMEWVGLRNYARLVRNDLFLQSFTNTLLILFIVGAAIFVVAFALTLVLRDMAGKRTARNVLFFPHLINALVFGALAGFAFNPNGLVNSFLRAIGVSDPPLWLARDNLLGLVMAILAWASVGYYTTILMAGVDRIPEYFFEDAALAGASAFQRLRYVILPLTWDVFAVCAVLWTITSVKIFEIVWIFGGTTGVGLPPQEIWTSAVYTYIMAFSGQSIPSYGMASASAMLALLLVAVLIVLLRRVTRREALEF
ncbi:carbohydrate ABC transporter permease [Pseudactinotalea sp. Z1739]|uniref:carbohydrate ABC transporter permease n=1 Tax=Pseudactinotalea sp. Z1739 TaxID=3413028 RepID=UPI003C7C6AE2